MKQMTIFDYEIRPGTFPTYETRASANESVDKQKRYNQILEILKNMDKPMTAKEIAVEMKNKGYVPMAERNFSAPRITELLKMGVLEVSTKRICKYTGKMVTAYKIRKEN